MIDLIMLRFSTMKMDRCKKEKHQGENTVAFSWLLAIRSGKLGQDLPGPLHTHYLNSLAYVLSPPEACVRERHRPPPSPRPLKEPL